MKRVIKNLSDLKPADYNPREISNESFEGLKYSINEFGDLSGIVFNKQTGNLVAGHQRVKALIQKYGDLKIKSFNDDHGSIIANGETFPIRYVDWDIKKEKAANIAANNPAIQGTFTPGVKLLIEEIQLDNSNLFDKLLINEIEIPIDVSNVLPATEAEQGRLDERSLTKCPECGHEFKPKA